MGTSCHRQSPYCFSGGHPFAGHFWHVLDLTAESRQAEDKSTEGRTAKNHVKTLAEVLPFGNRADDPSEPAYPEVLKQEAKRAWERPIHFLEQIGTLGL